MKKYDFFCHPDLLLQDFCKKAQWRAKKLRERGSNTARPTEKGGGGLPIGARPVDFGASCRSIRSVSARRFVPIRSVSARRCRSIRSCRFRRVVSVGFGARPVGFVASRRSILECCLCRVASRFGRSVRSRRVCRCRSMVTDTDTDTEGKTQKSPIPYVGDRAQLLQGVARS